MTRIALSPFSGHLAPLLGAVLVAASPCTALAQSAAPAASAPQTAASGTKAPAVPTIKRWVDQRGQVHFSDAPPPANERPAKPVTEMPTAKPLTADERARAQAELERARRTLAEKPEATASSPSTPAPAPRAKGPAPGDQSCAAQWTRYNAAYACMDAYRVSHGGIRKEGFANCPVVKQPECAAPSSQ